MQHVFIDVATADESLRKAYPAIERVLGHMRLRLQIPLHECSRNSSSETPPTELSENLTFGKAIEGIGGKESTVDATEECRDEYVLDAQIESADAASIAHVRDVDDNLENNSCTLNVRAHEQKQKYVKAKQLALKKCAEFSLIFNKKLSRI